LCRLQARMPRDALETPLEKICAQLSAPGVGSQVTPIQAVASLTALSKLQHRDRTAAAVFSSVLAGRGGNVAWTWAPSAFFFAHAQSRWAEGSELNEKQCLNMFNRGLDSSHCIDVLHSLQRLDLHSTLVSRLVMLYCERLVPHLHELRAREVLVVARALSASRFPGPLAEKSLRENVAAYLGVGGAAETQGQLAGAPASWRERAVDSCFENLRRHEHFLEASWNTLLPLKLLCMEIDTEAYGSRRLVDILSPSLCSFVSRLRGLTRLECEANRLQKLAEQEDEDTNGDAAKAAAAAAAAASAGDDPTDIHQVVQLARHRLVLSGHIQHFPVDLVVEAVV